MHADAFRAHRTRAYVGVVLVGAAVTLLLLAPRAWQGSPIESDAMPLAVAAPTLADESDAFNQNPRQNPATGVRSQAAVIAVAEETGVFNQNPRQSGAAVTPMTTKIDGPDAFNQNPRQNPAAWR